MRRLALLLFAAACQHAPGDGGGDGADDGVDDSEVTGPSCAAPTLTAPYTAEGADAVLVGLRRAPNAAAAGRNELRPVVVEATGRGSITVDVEGDFLVFDAKGRPLTLPLTTSSADLPRTILIGADVQGSGTLTATPTSTEGGCTAVSLALGTHRWHDLAARPLPREPDHLVVDGYRSDEPVDVLLDAHLLPDRAGLAGDVYVVPHKTAAGWVDDPALVDVTGGAEAVTFPAVGKVRSVNVWAPPLDPGDGHPAAYDVVVDFGKDGRLDPGDLIDGFHREPGLVVLGDLSRPGPYTPRMQNVDASPAMQVWWPTDVPDDQKPLPLVMISHGNGHDYHWYGFIGQHLASWGFVVASHWNNTGPGILTASTSTLNATNWIVNNRETAIGGALAGLVDPHRIAWIGHSRGGEGVVRAYQRLLGATQPTAPSTTYTAADIRAIVSIAPTVFDGVVRSNPGEVPYLELYGAADGDVNGGADCDLCQSMRIPAAARGPVSIVYVHGASHNVFHDGAALAGAVDEGIGPNRVGPELVHPAELSWLLAWTSWHLLDQPGYRDVFARAASDFRPAGVPAALDLAVTWRQGLADDALVLDDFQSNPDPGTSSLGATVTFTGTDAVAPTALEGVLDDGNFGFGWVEGDFMNGMTLVSGRDSDQSGGVLTWQDDATWTLTLPEPTDVRGWDTLTLVAAQTTRHPNTVDHNAPLTFAVVLADEDGNTSLVPTDAVGVVSDVYPRDGLGPGNGWANEWNTLRIPLRTFVTPASGLDPSRLRRVSLRFGEAFGARTGRIGLDDLAFVP